jgi:hypothetical protein
MSGHVLTCRHCGKTFTARRRDAIGCSRSCRRHLSKTARDAAPIAVAPTADTDELNGWRRVPGGYVIPAADPRNTFFIDPDALRRL